MGLVVVLAQVVAVVGGHQGQARLLGQLHEPVVDDLLLFEAVGLQLQVEAVREDVHVLPGHHERLVEGAVAQGVGHLALQAGREADDPLAVGAQELLVHARLVVEPVQEPGGHDLDQVVVADEVLGQQDQMEALLVLPVGHVVGDVDFAADDGLDAVLLGFEVEGYGPEEIAMVGDGGCGKAEIHGPRAQVLQADGAVQEAVLGMAM